MKILGIPDWMGFYLSVRAKSTGLSESDYHLHGAGRALGFVRMATCALAESYSGQEVGEYHAYTGISAARTAIDAIAVWFNTTLQLDVVQGPEINLSRKDFRKKVSKASLEVSTYVQALGTLGKQIDKHRQRAQHREGLAISPHMDSEQLGHPGGWYLMPQGLSGDRTADLRLVDLLNGWANEIEDNLREILKVMASGEMQEAEQLIAWLSQLNSSA